MSEDLMLFLISDNIADFMYVFYVLCFLFQILSIILARNMYNKFIGTF